MADSDVQILATGEQAAPLDYVIKDTVVLNLKAVSALFTDNGAGGDWLPSVVLLSDSGHVIARASDQGVKVTAGNDAEVSWFPGVKPSAAATPAGGTAVFARAWNDSGAGDPSQTVNAHTRATSSFAHTTTTDGTVIAFSTGSHTNDTATITGTGVALIFGSAQWDLVDVNLGSLVRVPAGLETFAHSFDLPTSNPTVVSTQGLPTTQDYSLVQGSSVVQLLHENDLAANHVVFTSFLSIVFIPTA